MGTMMSPMNKTATTLICLLGISNAFSPQYSAFKRTIIPHQTINTKAVVSSTQQYMFGGAGSPLAEDDSGQYTPEEEANIQAAAKQLGFSASEYKLVLRMQANLKESVDSLRVTGGEASSGVMVSLDGNSPPKFLKVEITDDGKALGKATLESTLMSALKDANEQAKKGNAAAVEKMNADIAEELKKMGA